MLSYLFCTVNKIDITNNASMDENKNNFLLRPMQSIVVHSKTGLQPLLYFPYAEYIAILLLKLTPFFLSLEPSTPTPRPAGRKSK